MSSDTILGPNELFSLGFQTDSNGVQLGWSDYWEMIVVVVDTTISDHIKLVSIISCYVLFLFRKICIVVNNN